MKKMLVKLPLTLEYNFNKIKEVMTVASSKDGKFRIYSWDSQDGGTMHGFNSILQFKVGEDVRASIYYVDTFLNGEWTGPGYFYSDVHTIASKAGKTYYLAIKNGIYSSALSSLGVQCFSIENGRVNDSIKLFKTKTELLNKIDIELDYTVLTIMNKYPEIHFSVDSKQMFIPLVTDKKVTDKYLIYKFDGNYYTYSGIGTYP